jgi:hypothetical protein
MSHQVPQSGHRHSVEDVVDRCSIGGWQMWISSIMVDTLARQRFQAPIGRVDHDAS